MFYPYPADVPLWQAVLAGLLLAGISVVVLRSFRERPYLAVGWLWYLGTLVPVIGLVQVGAQARADRYMYVPMVGLAIMLAWGAAEWRWIARQLAGLGGMVACIAVTWVQIGYWRSSETLFRHAIEVTSGNYLAHHNLGVALAEEPGRLPEAIAQYEAALEIKPDYARARTDLGNALSKTPGRLRGRGRRSTRRPSGWNPGRDPAQRPGEHAVADPGTPAGGDCRVPGRFRIEPDYAEAHNNLGSALASMGRLPEAIAEFEAALGSTPATSRRGPTWSLPRPILRNQANSAEVEYNQAVALLKNPGHEAQAIPHLEAALADRPQFCRCALQPGSGALGNPRPDARGDLPSGGRIADQARIRNCGNW